MWEDLNLVMGCFKCHILISDLALPLQMRMASSLQVEQKSRKHHTQLNQCANCILFGWKQLDEGSLQQCGKCKILQYCSKQCQVEHWMLVHKDHCKKLARAKELQEEGKDLSKVQVSISSHHPFPAKGLLKDTTETFVVLILRILSKMRLTPKSAYDLPYFHEKLTKLERAMDKNRRMIWTNRKIRPEQFRIAAVDTCRDQYFRTKEAVVMVKNKASEDLWPTLHLVWGRLMEHMVTLQIDMLKDPRSAVPLEVWDGLEDGIGPFPDRLKELVTALCSTKFPSFKNLLSIYCGGSLVQDCSFCSIPVTVAAVEGEVLGWQGGMVKGVATALHLPYMPPMYCCGSASCKEKMLEKHSVWTDWAVAVWTVINKLGFSVCHNCFKLAEEIHRFSRLRYQI